MRNKQGTKKKTGVNLNINQILKSQNKYSY